MAGPQPARPDPIYIHTYSAIGGMDTKNEVHLLAENRSVLLQNLDVSKEGGRKRRTGVADIGGRSDTPYGAWRAQDVLLSQEVLVATYSNKVYVFPGSGVISQRACGISLTNALHQGIEGRYNGRLATYITQFQVADSSATLATKLAVMTDDNTWTQASMMAPRGGAWFQNRFWAFDNSLAQNNETLWFSSLGDGLSYSANNTLQIEPGIGGAIIGVVPLRLSTPGLVVLKERAVAVLTPFWGSSSSLIPAAADALDTIKSGVRLVTDNAGCVATGSVQATPGAKGGVDVVFLSAQGLRGLYRDQNDNLVSPGVPLSDPVKATIERINFNFAKKATSAVFDNKYHIGLPLDGATELSHVLSWDMVTGAFFLNTWTPKAFVVARMTQSAPTLWMQYNTQTADCSVTGAETSAHMFRCLTGLNDPGGIPVLYQEDTRGFTWDGIDHKNIFDNLQLTVRNEAQYTAVMTLLYNVDQRGWVTMASCAIGGVNQAPILGVTPLPWGGQIGVIRTFRFNLADVTPGYEIQIRYLGQSDLSIPTILDLAVGARPAPRDFDQSIG
jgi:hypothetical protein